MIIIDRVFKIAMGQRVIIIGARDRPPGFVEGDDFVNADDV